MRNKRGLELDMLGWIIIAIIVLVVLVVGYAILTQTGSNILEQIKNIFRFG